MHAAVKLLKHLSSKRMVKHQVHANVVGLVFQNSRQAQEFGELIRELQKQSVNGKVVKNR